MDITRTLTFAALLLIMGVGYARTAGGAAVTTMIVMDSAQKKAEAERDGTLAATPVAQCSMCHQEILPFTHLPVIPDTTIMGHNTTEPNPESVIVKMSFQDPLSPLGEKNAVSCRPS